MMAAEYGISAVWRVATLREKLVIVIGILYVVLPLDIIPELFLGPLGLLDDGGAILVIISAIWAASKRLHGQQQNHRTVIDGEEIRK